MNLSAAVAKFHITCAIFFSLAVEGVRDDSRKVSEEANKDSSSNKKKKSKKKKSKQTLVLEIAEILDVFFVSYSIFRIAAEKKPVECKSFPVT